MLLFFFNALANCKWEPWVFVSADDGNEDCWVTLMHQGSRLSSSADVVTAMVRLTTMARLSWRRRCVTWWLRTQLRCCCMSHHKSHHLPDRPSFLHATLPPCVCNLCFASTQEKAPALQINVFFNHLVILSVSSDVPLLGSFKCLLKLCFRIHNPIVFHSYDYSSASDVKFLRKTSLFVSITFFLRILALCVSLQTSIRSFLFDCCIALTIFDQRGEFSFSCASAGRRVISDGST